MIELACVLATPLITALLLALFGHRRGAPEINSAGSLLTLVAAGVLTARVVSDGPMTLFNEQFFVDPLNVFLIALTALVGFTTSLFSRPYMRVEHDHGRLSVARLRLYHSMFQMFMCTMLTALSTNNLGILWVAMEAATLTTVLLVALYRTPASLEAAWKYFILCGVGIAQALHEQGAKVILGNIDEKQVLQWASDTLDGLGKAKPVKRQKPRFYASIDAYPRKGDHMYVGMAFPGLTAKDPASYAQDVLSTIIGGGASSRLNRKVREEEGLVYSIYMAPSSYSDSGTIESYFSTSGDRVQRVIQIFGEELKRLKAEGLAPAVRALPTLEFRRVCDAATRADFSYLMTVSFGLPPPVAREIYESEGTWSGGLTGWLGYCGNVAVTSAATLSTDAAVGVYAVGTPPTHRRKGFAEAIVRQALAEAGPGGRTAGEGHHGLFPGLPIPESAR